MIHFENLVTHNLSDRKESINQLCKFVDGFYEFSVIGRELLAYSDNFSVVEKVIEKSTVEKIGIWSSGSLCDNLSN